MSYSYDRRRVATEDPAAYGRETAELVTKAAARFVYDMLDDIMRSKEITHHRGVDERVLKREIGSRAEPYFVRAYTEFASPDSRTNGLADAADVDGEFRREVMRPALTAVFKLDAKYQGFGPLSYFGRLRKIERIPHHGIMYKRAELFRKAHPAPPRKVRVKRRR